MPNFEAFTEPLRSFYSERLGRIHELVRGFPENAPPDAVALAVANQMTLPVSPRLAEGSPLVTLAGRDASEVALIRLSFPLTAEGDANLLKFRVPGHLRAGDDYASTTDSRVVRLREGWPPEPVTVDPVARRVSLVITERELRLTAFRAEALHGSLATTLERLAFAIAADTPPRCVAWDLQNRRALAITERDETTILARLAELGLRARRQAELLPDAEPVIVGPELAEENNQ